MQRALDRAIRGVGPLDGAAMAAEKERDEHNGDIDKAIKEIIETHVRLAGAQGFVTNVGGLVTMTVSVPANVAGLALIQCRMVAASRTCAATTSRTGGCATPSWPACWVRSACSP